MGKLSVMDRTGQDRTGQDRTGQMGHLAGPCHDAKEELLVFVKSLHVQDYDMGKGEEHERAGWM